MHYVDKNDLEKYKILEEGNRWKRIEIIFLFIFAIIDILLLSVT